MNKQTDYEEFNEMLGTIAMMAQVEITDRLVAAYWLAMQHHPIELVRRACSLTMQRTKNFYNKLPPAGEIMAWVDDTDQRAALAWDWIDHHIRGTGFPMIRFTCEDKLVHATLRSIGGPGTLGQMKAEDYQTWGRKKVIEEFKRLAVQGIPAELLTAIPGSLQCEVHGGQVVTEVMLPAELAKRPIAIEAKKAEALPAACPTPTMKGF
jgi:hypothetical protein